MKLLSGNQLKVLAAIFMTLDHIGYILFPHVTEFNIIGRLAFPIFAYTFAEGCKYTKNRWRHFFMLLIVGALCQAAYTFFLNSLYQNILITFSLSALVIYSYDFAKKNNNILGFILCAVSVIGAYFVCNILPWRVGSDFCIDYGFVGVMLPVLIYIGNNKTEKLLLLTLGLLFLIPNPTSTQVFSLFAVPLISLYSGSRGKWRMKNFFYIYYPLHLAVIYLVGIYLI